MALESAADRRALIAIDGDAVRIYPGGVPLDRVAQYDGPGEEIQAVGSEVGVVDTAPSIYLETSQLAGLRHRERVEVLEGHGIGDYIASKIKKEDEGAFSRVFLADR